MIQPLKILFAASEAVPFEKTGGLADVAGALPKALEALGHEVIVVLPRYYSIDKSKFELLPGALGVPMGSMGELWAGIYKGILPGSNVAVYFIDYEEYFGRKGLYDENGFAYNDNDNRFIFLSKAAMQLCKKLHFVPDVIHANDWHTAAMPVLCNTRYRDDPTFKDSISVLTLHNMQHQGHFYKGAMDVMEIGWEHFTPMELEDFDGVNILKGGISHADIVTTVSKKYAKEIQTAEFGWGLDYHIAQHNYKLFGILNGVDYNEWSPAIDPYIAANFDTDTLEKKALCKADLQRKFNLPVRDDVPLIGFVGRFAEQKGIELIAGVVGGLLHLDLQIIMLGTGEQWAEGFFSGVAGRHGDKFACYIGYNNELAHIIEAGSDLFLMPSIFEPCGLNQIYSLRYGTLPIVRATGGLDDTIENFNPQTKEGHGFKFEFAANDALYHTVKWAVDTWQDDRVSFQAMQQRAMQLRFGWDDAAKAYEAIYYAHLSKKRIQAYQ